jgi:hypothetical protein
MKRTPDATSSPSKTQRFEGQNIVVDAEQLASHSGTPQSRRSSFDPLRTTAPSESTLNSSNMSRFLKMELFDTTFEVPPGLIEEINKRNCISFVGTGFTAPLVADWHTLLKMLLEDAKMEVDDFNASNSENAVEVEESFRLLMERANKLKGASSAEYGGTFFPTTSSFSKHVTLFFLFLSRTLRSGDRGSCW